MNENRRHNKNRRSKNAKRVAERTKRFNDRAARDEYRRDDDRGSRASRTNDPSWYMSNPALAKDAAAFNFSWATGTPLRTTNPIYSDFTVPGICSVQLMPAFGFAERLTDPINQAAYKQYSFVRHANSGSANYDAPDLMNYILGISSVISYIEFLRRVYGVSSLFTTKNRYYPKAILEAMGVNFNSVIANRANFRYRINVLISKLASYAIPNSYPLYNRLAFTYAGLYTDGPSMKDQIYMFNPKGFARYGLISKSVDDAPAGSLLYVPFHPALSGFDPSSDADITQFDLDDGRLFTADELIDYGEMLLKPFMLSEDLNIMSGDIIKAYGDNIMKYAYLDENYSILPSYDEVVLHQFKNLKFSNTCILNEVLNGGELRMYDVQANNYPGTKDSDEKPWPMILQQDLTDENYGLLYSRIGFGGTALTFPDRENVFGDDVIVTANVAEPGPDLLMEMTRLTTCGVPEHSYQVNDVMWFMPYWCGTEVVTDIKYYAMSTSGVLTPIQVKATSVTYTQSGTAFSNVLKAVSAREFFDYAPEYTIYSEGNGGSITSKYIVYDLDNYAVLAPTDLSRLHECAILSLLNITAVGELR